MNLPYTEISKMRPSCKIKNTYHDWPSNTALRSAETDADRIPALQGLATEETNQVCQCDNGKALSELMNGHNGRKDLQRRKL